MSRPFAAPASDLVELDERAALPPLIVRAGGFTFGASGFFMAAAGLQLLVFFYLSMPLQLVAGLQVMLGLGAIAVAPFVIKGRGWAAVLGSGLAAAMMFVSLPWNAYALFQLLLSPLMWLSAFFCVAAMALVPFTVLPSIKVSAARRALYAS